MSSVIKLDLKTTNDDVIWKSTGPSSDTSASGTFGNNSTLQPWNRTSQYTSAKVAAYCYSRTSTSTLFLNHENTTELQRMPGIDEAFKEMIKDLPEELREKIWQELDNMSGFYFDFYFNNERKGVYIKGDNLLSWNAFVADELYESNWQNIRDLGFELTATLEVRYLQVSHVDYEIYDWVPEWCFEDVEEALYNNGFRVIEYLNAETGEVQRVEWD